MSEADEKKKKPITLRHVVIAFMVLVGLAFVGILFYPAKRQEVSALQPAQPPPTASEQTTNQTPVPAASPSPEGAPASASDTPQPETKSVSCYNNPGFQAIAPQTAQKRRDYANQVTQALKEDSNGDGFYAYTGGDDDQYLFVTSTPDSEPTLRAEAANMQTQDSVLATICIDGFLEVQFIVQDENMQHRTLVGRIRPDPDKAFAYIMHGDYAKPLSQ
jgi:hypothetical protein